MKREMYYHWHQYDWQDEGKISVHDCDMSEYGDYILLKIIEVEIPDVVPPTREQVAKHKVAKLKEEKEKLRAETQIKLNVIEDKIRQLQALEYKQ